jgi:hypothetical protein
MSWHEPSREFSLAPFWFWNDDLTEAEIIRQMDDFQAHGVHAFVLHPRVGLPRRLGWMSRPLLDMMRFVVDEAARRGMWLILYDEGMYPSGSSSGQVVAENPAYQVRAMVPVVLADDQTVPDLEPGQTLVAIASYNDQRIAIVDRPYYGVIRGLHYTEDDPPRQPDYGDPPEDLPLAADLLNPDAVAAFVRLVYDRFYQEFGDHFGTTIPAIFTDEPMLLGRPLERGGEPGTTGIMDHINAYLGYDFRPHLPALWYDDVADAARYRRDFERAIYARLEQTYYRQLSDWCAAHNIALTGHPHEPDAIGQERYFQWPGQDIVWRYIEPDKPTALEGSQSTNAKCASSAMIHLGQRRNINEYCGAYGHDFTFEEMKWLTHWLIVRGCNLLIPHAFYYSTRGPRIDERPPDVGPNAPWWDDFKPYADASARMCWLNTDSQHVCHVAILGEHDHLPWRAAKTLFQNQVDFNYLEVHHLFNDAQIGPDGVSLAGMHYDVLVIDDDLATPDLTVLGDRLLRWDDFSTDAERLSLIDALVVRDVTVRPAAPGLRVRHVVKDGTHYYLLFNEGSDDFTGEVRFAADGKRHLLDPMYPDEQTAMPDSDLSLPGYAFRVVAVG